MATITWPRLRDRIKERIRPAAPAHEQSLRRVALRLAAQSVMLLLVMVIVLEVAVYIIVQQNLVGNLEDTLKQRAGQEDPTVCHRLQLPCARQFPLGPGGPGGGSGQPQPGTGQPQPGSGQGAGSSGGSPGSRLVNADINPSEASVVYVDASNHIIHHDGYLSVLLDPQAARAAVRTNQAQSFSVHSYRGQDYLVYTKPKDRNGRAVGAAQSSVSEHEYEGTMRTLLETLLLVALLGLVGSGGISAVLTRRSLQPIRLAMQRQRDFVADAAHELRTPLAVMRTVGEVGLTNESSEDQQATIEQMLAENRHLTRLVDDLSLLARVDTHTLAIDRRPVDLSSLVADTAAELEPLAFGQGVTLTADVQGNVEVLGDIVRLRQLLLILVDNALKHTPAGGTVQVALQIQSGRARLQVADSGPGIDPADLPRIFDRFYRADRSRTGEGSGLGLAIGRWITEAHGGSIQAANAPDHGAVFTVTLPLARSSPSL